jgi:hypothetical protein
MTLRNVITAAAMAVIVAPLHPGDTPKEFGHKFVESKSWKNASIALFASNSGGRTYRLKNFSNIDAMATVDTSGRPPRTTVRVPVRARSTTDFEFNTKSPRIASIERD